MDTEGPVSVLDRRTRSSSRDRVIADRITRQRSPGPAFRRGGRSRKGSQTSVDDVRAGETNEEGAEEAVVYRISQPYRTSFSAAHSVTWGVRVPPKSVDRSRSLSPTASVRSNASIMSAPPGPYSSILHNSHYRPSTGLMAPADKRRPRGRSKSPKRVTYNTRVTVRHSDTEDNMFTQLSEGEDYGIGEYGAYDAPLRPITSPFARSMISPRYNEFSQLSPSPSAASSSSQVSPPLSYASSSSTVRRYDITNNIGNKNNPSYTNSTDSINNKFSQPPPLPPAQRRVRDVTNTTGRGMPSPSQLKTPKPSSSVSTTPVSSSSTGRGQGPKSTHWSSSPAIENIQKPVDYTSELVDLSQQITQMEWSPRQIRSSRGRPPPGPSSPKPGNRGNINSTTTTPSIMIGDKINRNATPPTAATVNSARSHADNQLFSPPPGGTASTPVRGGSNTATTTATTQSPAPPPPSGILKDSQNHRSRENSDQENDHQGPSQLQSGVISSGNGIVREGVVLCLLASPQDGDLKLSALHETRALVGVELVTEVPTPGDHSPEQEIYIFFLLPAEFARFRGFDTDANILS
ncbi:disks large-associated protein 1 [Plakobranchus ocellatus]|uniref:Disks large-associated protein 1 n=1 Tax=Plakobranchus ocellatus TaxID=259542 RepID=A0AAV4A5T4_9GAST|nr:disks large-associated protein 1 [Plakobranchus ocellatus]